MQITLEEGRLGWDYLLRAEDGRSVLIQSDREYPSFARTFGWQGEEDDVQGAQAYLEDQVGVWVEDPGYFGPWTECFDLFQLSI